MYVNKTRSCTCNLKYLLLYKWFWIFFYFSEKMGWSGDGKRNILWEWLNWNKPWELLLVIEQRLTWTIQFCTLSWITEISPQCPRLSWWKKNWSTFCIEIKGLTLEHFWKIISMLATMELRVTKKYENTVLPSLPLVWI